MIMKVGIPRAFLYYRYRTLWETFFEELDVEYIVTPETNKEIISRGTTYAIDEACLSSKIYLGHVEWLIDKCDYILVPRISNYGSSGTVCTKFQAIYDVVSNTFRDRNIKLLNYNIDLENSESELKAFWKMGRLLGKKRSSSMRAYIIAKYKERASELIEQRKQEELLKENKIKVLLVAHRYNIDDEYIGLPILNYLRDMGAIPIIADIANKKEVIGRSANISNTLPWTFNKELVGAVEIYKDKIDGIILISSFPCGPDSLVNEIIIRRVKDKPILNLILDGQEGSAGIETRLDSFIDIINFKREDYNG
jgi:predicted nucleotide-binding protein (sugar kinase/HSP70/actin superfamily)